MRPLSVLSGICLLVLLACPAAAEWRVLSDKSTAGFGHPESVAYDPATRTLFVSRFGPELKPRQKDGQGFISQLDLQGRVLKERYLPRGKQVLHKPKGLWIVGGRLWVTDIDAAWVFDLASGRGRKVSLPGAKFANDPVVQRGVLYISDTAAGAVYAVQPADFLKRKPKVSLLVRGQDLFPNGLAIDGAGRLLVGSWPFGEKLGGLHRLGPGTAQALGPAIGKVDGLARLPDGTLLFTDWAAGRLAARSPKGRIYDLASGMKGPADFGLVPSGSGYLVVVPDLVTGVIRFISIAR